MAAVMTSKLALLVVLGLIFIGCGKDDAAKPAGGSKPACGCGCGDGCGDGDEPADTPKAGGGGTDAVQFTCSDPNCTIEKTAAVGATPPS